MSRALILSIAAFACAASLALAADEYPARAVRIVVPFAPGGGTDVVGRILAQQLTQRLKQSFVIDNRPAGSGIVGADDGLVGHARPVQDASSGDRPAQPRGSRRARRHRGQAQPGRSGHGPCGRHADMDKWGDIGKRLGVKLD